MTLSTLGSLLHPVLDRVVVTGRAAVDLHLSTEAPASKVAAHRTVRVLSSWTLDRLAQPLHDAGWERIARTPKTDRWRHPRSSTIDVEYVAGGGDEAEAWVEYATLLTTSVAVAGPTPLRVSAPVPTLALLIADWRASGESAIDSVPLEDALQLLSGRAALRDEIMAAPLELRDFVRAALVHLSRYRGVESVLTSAIPGARVQPRLASRAAERLRVLAGASASGT